VILYNYISSLPFINSHLVLHRSRYHSQTLIMSVIHRSVGVMVR